MGLYHGLIGVVGFYQDGLSVGWVFIEVVSHGGGGGSSRWSHLGGFSSRWSLNRWVFIKVVFK